MHAPAAAAPAIAFAGSPLDRADHIRVDNDALAGLMNWRAKVLLMDGLLPGVDEQGGLVWGSLADVPEDAELVFLGMQGGKAHFAPVPGEGADGPAYAMPRAWQLMTQLSPPDLAIYGGARSLADWHARHRFCARCGSATKLVKGGRQPRFPPKMYSALAGFVEPGETIEEAVAREIHEEAGVRVRDVKYIASQPWPFPSQLMIGCTSVADDPELTIDTTELEDARWFTREELQAARAAGEAGTDLLYFPRPFAIAHTLVTWWLDR